MSRPRSNNNTQERLHEAIYSQNNIIDFKQNTPLQAQKVPYSVIEADGIRYVPLQSDLVPMNKVEEMPPPKREMDSDVESKIKSYLRKFETEKALAKVQGAIEAKREMRDLDSAHSIARQMVVEKRVQKLEDKLKEHKSMIKETNQTLNKVAASAVPMRCME